MNIDEHEFPNVLNMAVLPSANFYVFSLIMYKPICCQMCLGMVVQGFCCSCDLTELCFANVRVDSGLVDVYVAVQACCVQVCKCMYIILRFCNQVRPKCGLCPLFWKVPPFEGKNFFFLLLVRRFFCAPHSLNPGSTPDLGGVK